MSMANRLQESKAYAGWVNTNQKSEKSQNDVRQASAFQKVKEIMGAIQNKQKPLQDSMDTLRQSLDTIQGSEDKLTKSQAKVLSSLYTQMKDMLGQVKEMVQSLHQQAGIVTAVSGSSEDTQQFDSPDDSSDDSPITLTSGMQAQAQSILAEIQAQFNQLNILYNTMRQRALSNSNALVTSLAQAARDVGTQESNMDKAEMYSNFTQMGTSAVSLGVNMQGKFQIEDETKAPQEQLNEMNDIRGRLTQNGVGGMAVGDAPPKEFTLKDLSDDDKVYYAELKDGNFAKPQPGVNKDKVMSVIRGDPATKQSVMKLLSEQSSAASTTIQTAFTRYQQREARWNSGMQMVNAGVTASMKGLEAGYAATKGADEAVRATSQVANDQNNKSADEMDQHAQEASKAAQQAIQRREAVQQYNEAK